MKKIRVGAVNYLNTKPMLYGIKRHPVMEEIELVEDYPANIASMVVDGTLDMGLIPVAATKRMKEWHIVSDYCIGCDGVVASVCIFSQVPMDGIEKVYLDYQSRTSVNLAKILLKEYWKKEVEFIDAKGEDFRSQIAGNTAGVVIGDRALEQRQHSAYIYDLGEAWKAHTGLPFVFAAWIANKQLPDSFKMKFDEGIRFGLDHLPEVIAENEFTAFNLNAYYSKYIQFPLDNAKSKGLHLFLEKLQQLK